MGLCKIVIRDEVYCTITGLKQEHNKFLYDHLGVFAEGYRWMPAFKLGRWDGKIRFFEATGKTYVRLLDEIIPYLVKWGYTFDLEDNRVQFPPITDRITEDHFSYLAGYGGEPLMIRRYQVETINKLLDAGSGFALAGTGSGKTMICAGLCDMYGRAGHRTMTIVPSGDLVTQTRKAYQMCELDVGEYSGDIKILDRTHTVATWQSLQNNPHIMGDYSMVLIDEAHGAKADVVQSLINEYGGHIPFRFGVTGTFPKPAADQLTLHTTIGPILHTITSRWLIDNGYLSEVSIEVIQTVETADLPDYQSEKSYLSKKESRLALIADLIQEKMREHGNTLVLVNSVVFGRQLQKLIPNSVFMSGETDKDTRQENYSEYDFRDDVIKIATSGIASTGISIDRIFCMFLVDAGKSYIKAIQSIGRGTRKAHDKNRVHVVDCCSTLKFSKKHLKERLSHYKETEYNVSKNKKIKYED